jgi:hypothetical protein
VIQQKPYSSVFYPGLSRAPFLWRGCALFAPFNGGLNAHGLRLFGENGGVLPGSELTAGSSLEWRATPYGPAVGISGASNLLERDNFEPVVTSNGAGTGDFTMMILANPISESRGSFAITQTSTSNNGVQVQFNTAGNISSPVAGSVAVRIRDGAGTNDTSASSVLDGGYHSLIIARSGTKVRIFSDGILRGESSDTVRNITSGGTLGFSIGQRAEATNGRIDTACNVVVAGAWNRALDDFEAALLARDPFIMMRLRPAVFRASAPPAGNNLQWKLAGTQARLAGQGGLAA